MGLKAEFNLSRNNYPRVVHQTVTLQGVSGNGSSNVDYTSACSAFVSTFMDWATSLVPVRTGFLRSTIKAETNGSTYCMVEAKAEYAQYVEYGTWKMKAQPYFVPALRAAMESFQAEAIRAINRATTKARDQARRQAQQRLREEKRNRREGGVGILGGTLFTGILFLVFFPLLVAGTAVVDAMSRDGYVGNNRNGSNNVGVPGLQMPTIEIT